MCNFLDSGPIVMGLIREVGGCVMCLLVGVKSLPVEASSVVDDFSISWWVKRSWM